MTNAEIREFKSYVRDTLVRKYHLNEVEAARAVRDSYLSKALAMDKDFVDHDTVEEWAEFIYDEIKHETDLPTGRSFCFLSAERTQRTKKIFVRIRRFLSCTL